MLPFEVAIRTARLEANCDVVLYSLFESSAAWAACQTYPVTSKLAQWWVPCAPPAAYWNTKLKETPHDTEHPHHSATV